MSRGDQQPEDAAQPSDEEDLDLQLAARLDALGGTFLEERKAAPDLTARVFAARHPDVEGALRPFLEGLLAFAGATREVERTVLGAHDSLSKGMRIGPYEVVGVLGRGGMGVVYEAVEVGLDRRVALKAIRASDGNERFRARFVREGRAAAQLDHPGIVPVLGAGEDGDVLWYAMRLVRGHSLEALLAAESGNDPENAAAARRTLERPESGSGSRSALMAGRPPRELGAARIALGLTRALDEAHRQGILHRDVKPGNVLVDQEGRTLLTDFGLCKVEGDASLTEATDVVGTLRYMPPEGLRGHVDARGDVYGVGMILFEMIAKRPAHEGTARHALVDRILHHDPPPLSQVAAGTSLDLERIVRKATSKLVDERYASAAALASDLDAFLDGRPVEARAPSTLYLARLFARRNPGLTAVTAVGLVILIAVTAIYVAGLQRAFRDAQNARTDAEASRSEALLATAEATLRTSDARGARAALKEVPEDDRGWLWRHFSARVEAPESVGSMLPTRVKRLSAGPTSDTIIEHSRSGVALRDARTLEIRSVHEAISGASVPVRDGRSVVGMVGMRRALSCVVWGDGPEPEVTSLGVWDVGQFDVCVAETARLLFLVNYDGVVEARALDAAEQALWQVPVGSQPVVMAAREPDGLFLGMEDGRILAVREGGTEVVVDRQHPAQVSCIIAEEGELLVSGDSEGRILLQPAITGGPTLRTRVRPSVVAMALDPQRRVLAVATGLGELHLVDVRSGARIREHSGPAAAIQEVLWTEDGWLIATDSGEFMRYPHGMHSGVIHLPPGLNRIYSIAASPPHVERALLVTYSLDGFAYVHDLESSRVTALSCSPLQAMPVGSFGPRGRLVSLGGSLYDLERRNMVASLKAEGMLVRQSVFDSTGALFAFAGKPLFGQEGLRLYRVPANELVPGAIQEEPTLELLGEEPEELLLGMHLPEFDEKRRLIYACLEGGRVAALRPDPYERVWTATPGESELCAALIAEETDELLLMNRDGEIHAVSLDDPSRVRSGIIAPPRSAIERVVSLATGPEPGTFVSCTAGGRIDLWSLATFERVGSLAGEGSGYRAIALDARTGWLAAAGSGGRTSLLGHGPPPARRQTPGTIVSEGDVWLPERITALERAPRTSAQIEMRKKTLRQLANTLRRSRGMILTDSLKARMEALEAAVPEGR